MVHPLEAEAFALVDDVIERYVTGPGYELAGIVVLFSGGNDSTVLAHLMRHRATHYGHCNTGIGIEQTRDFVRDTAHVFGLPLIEKHPPISYRELVIERGFPGPGQHYKMYQRLKERGLRLMRKDLVTNGRRQRVVFVAGRRRAESARRMNVPECEREGSVVWVSPLVDWTDTDMAEYRQRHPDVPRNEVAEMLHMSGECLCGAFAHEGELHEIDLFYPDVAETIRQLEDEVRAAGHVEPRCRWGWGRNEPSGKRGPLCDSCVGATDAG